jgi:hypothetical protein
LVSAGLLKPLGNPPPGSMKFFLAVEIEQKKNDAKWMNKASEFIRVKIKDKNDKAAKNRGRNGAAPKANEAAAT